MPAKSQAQQRAAGAALSAKRGRTKASELEAPVEIDVQLDEREGARKARGNEDQGQAETQVEIVTARAPVVLHSDQEVSMLRYALIFFIIAIIAAVLGFGGIAAGAAEIAKILFYIFVVIFLVTLVLGVARR